MLWGTVCCKHWAKTKGIVTLSSGEAEMVSLVNGVSEGLGVHSLAEDLGIQVGGQSYVKAHTPTRLQHSAWREDSVSGRIATSRPGTCGCRSASRGNM